jgi:hypothetical protein
MGFSSAHDFFAPNSLAMTNFPPDGKFGHPRDSIQKRNYAPKILGMAKLPEPFETDSFLRTDGTRGQLCYITIMIVTWLIVTTMSCSSLQTEQPSSGDVTPALHDLTGKLNEINLKDSPPASGPMAAEADPSLVLHTEDDVPMPGPHSFGMQQDFVRRMVFSENPRLACFFCRGRKIACGPAERSTSGGSCRYVLCHSSASSLTMLSIPISQCVRRSLKCEYPTNLKRGHRRRRKSNGDCKGKPKAETLIDQTAKVRDYCLHI